MGKTILAFDVGIKNLSYCLIQDKQIIKWDLINLILPEDKRKPVLTDVSVTLFMTLHDKFNDEHIDFVVIENQPVMKNPVMKSIQMLIFSYFQYSKIIEGKLITGVHFIGAGTKVKLAEQILHDKKIEFVKEGVAKYKYNKEIAKKCVSELLKEDTDEMLQFYSSNKKKDDLADCYLLALVYYFRIK